VRSVATLAAGPLLVAEGCAPHARAAAITGPPTGAQMRDFVVLSSALLGIAAAKLAPDPDPANTKADCFAAAQQHDAQKLAELLAIVDANRTRTPAEIADVTLNGSGQESSFFAKAVMLAWLLGSWYDPALLARAAASGSDAPIPSTVISANAYREAWAWKIAQTKAMGTSNQGFGYWTSAPRPLGDFIGEPEA